MDMKYKFDPKMQLAYGITSFIASFVLLFLILGRWELLTAAFVGAGNFIVAGFYTYSNCK